MKVLMIMALVSVSALAMSPATKKAKEVKNDKSVTKAAPKAEADCDKKAKKPIEITPTSISLSGNTGCSLDDMKKP